MEENENPSPVSGAHEAATPPGRPTRRSRFAVDDGPDLIDCSGKHCRSCTAALVADCVAICCCPCSVVSFLALALVKVPWMVGRRCLEQARKRRRKKKKKKMRVQTQREEMRSICGRGESDGAVAVETCGSPAKEEGLPEISSGLGLGEEEGTGNLSARFEAERIWLQLYQVGQLGFGRVSFTGNTNLWLNSN